MQLSSINVQNVKLLLKENSANFNYCECGFCHKTEDVSPNNLLLNETIAGSYYCSHCIRHGFHTRNNRNILMISFRAIPAYYYYYNYSTKGYKKIWLSEIKDMLELHAKTGLQNPVFSYDSDSYMWFVDFSKIGRGRKKIALQSVQETIINILSCFNLYKFLVNFRSSQLYNKYNESIVAFYEHRFLLSNQKQLIPSLEDCADIDKKANIELMRNFSSKNLK